MKKAILLMIALMIFGGCATTLPYQKEGVTAEQLKLDYDECYKSSTTTGEDILLCVPTVGFFTLLYRERTWERNINACMQEKGYIIKR